MDLDIAFKKKDQIWRGIKSVTATQMLAIREGLLWILPCLIISSLILFVASIGEFTVGKERFWVASLYRAYYGLNDVFPILLTAALSYILAMQWRLPRPPIALISIVYLALFHQLFQNGNIALTFELIISVLTPLYSIPLIAYLYRKKWLKVVSSDQVGRTVKDATNLILPAIITGMLVLTISWLLVNALSSLLDFGGLKELYQQSPINFGLLYSLFNSFLWFIGIHGYYALMPWIDVLQDALPTTIQAPQGEGVINHSMMAVFVFLGGCGATLGLVISLIAFSKDRGFRLIAIAALPLVLFNINEVLLFGLPIIFNPKLFWPFVFAPLFNLLVATAVLSAGWVTIPSVVVPFSSPMLLNSWLATQGDFGAPLLQVVLVALNVLIYTPFVLRINKVDRSSDIEFPFFDSSYSRRREEAEALSADKVSAKVEHQKETFELEQGLRHYSQIDFCMEYQPQINRVTGKVVSCEALIRAKEPNSGKLIYPGQFLPYFEQANMMGDIDLWAVKKVVSDIKVLQLEGLMIKTSINITPHTLLNRELMNRICRYIKPVAQWIDIEITEEALLEDKEKVSRSIKDLKDVGCKISIDDFGVGYSSLSYLSQFDVDAIKIDRNFVLSLDQLKGRNVFYAMLKVAQELNLDCVIEGVEKKSQLDLIPIIPNITIQGWYYSKSLSLKAFIHYVEQRNNTKRPLTVTKAHYIAEMETAD